MSRSRHSRPQRLPVGDEVAGLRNAAIQVADTSIRFDRAVDRFLKLVREARDGGASTPEIERVLQSAVTGRADRAKALNAVFRMILEAEERSEGDSP